jgi:hypothetical protein
MTTKKLFTRGLGAPREQRTSWRMFCDVVESRGYRIADTLENAPGRDSRVFRDVGNAVAIGGAHAVDKDINIFGRIAFRGLVFHVFGLYKNKQSVNTVTTTTVGCTSWLIFGRLLFEIEKCLRKRKRKKSMPGSTRFRVVLCMDACLLYFVMTIASRKR